MRSNPSAVFSQSWPFFPTELPSLRKCFDYVKCTWVKSIIRTNNGRWRLELRARHKSLTVILRFVTFLSSLKQTWNEAKCSTLTKQNQTYNQDALSKFHKLLWHQWELMLFRSFLNSHALHVHCCRVWFANKRRHVRGILFWIVMRLLFVMASVKWDRISWLNVNDWSWHVITVPQRKHSMNFSHLNIFGCRSEFASHFGWFRQIPGKMVAYENSIMSHLNIGLNSKYICEWVT